MSDIKKVLGDEYTKTVTDFYVFHRLQTSQKLLINSLSF